MKFFPLYFLYLVLILLFSNCTPPPNWKPSPYLIARPSGNKLPGDSRVRVKLYEGILKPVSSPFMFKFKNKSGSKFFKGKTFHLPKEAGTFEAKGDILLFRNKKYSGKIEVRKSTKGYIYINHVDMDQYLVSVVGHEMNNSWPLEALKAQTVVARSYVLTKINQALGSDYDVDTTVNHQVYGGIPLQKDNLERAVKATRSKVVVYRSGLAKVFFHSSCGGRLEASNEVWKETLPYLQTKRSKFCKKTPPYSWKYKIPLKQFEKVFSISGLKKLHVTKRTISKRTKEILAVTGTGKILIHPAKFRQKFGERNIKSYLFDIRLNGKQILVAGRGYGHGVGLCQWGSRVMAEQYKMNHRRILKHFFPNTALSRFFKTENLG